MTRCGRRRRSRRAESTGVMDHQQPPLPAPADGTQGVVDLRIEPQPAGGEGAVNPQLEPQAPGNAPLPLSQDNQKSIELADRVRKRHRSLKKRKSEIDELVKKSETKELSKDQMEKLETKATTDAIFTEFDRLVNPPKPQPEASTSQRVQRQKTRREVNLLVKELEKKANVVSFSNILSRATENQAVFSFEAFCTGFTLQGEYKSYCTGLAKSMLCRHARTMVIEYKHLEAHNKDMAMMISSWPSKMLPRLTNSARNFLNKIWAGDKKDASKEDVEGVKQMMVQFELQIAELPRSHKKLEVYMNERPMIENCVLDNLIFDRPTPSSNLMVSGILCEVIDKHRNGFAWNGNLTIADMEVKDDSKFIITKPPLHSFDPSLEISAEIAGWFKEDYCAVSVWETVCKKVKEAGNGPLPHYPALERKLTKTSIKVFCNPVKRAAFEETMLHVPAAKPALERAVFQNGVHTCCRAYDMEDPAAPYKTLLFTQEMPGSVWSERIEESGNAVLNGVLEFNQNDEDQDEPEDGPNKFYVGPHGIEFESLKDYMSYIQTHSHDPNGSTFGAYVDYSRHLSSHGTKYSRVKRKFKLCPRNRTDVQFFEPQDNQGPRHQRVHDLGIFESAAAMWVEDALTDMINLLLEENAMVGMLEPFWIRFKNCGNHPPKER